MSSSGPESTAEEFSGRKYHLLASRSCRNMSKVLAAADDFDGAFDRLGHIYFREEL